MHTVTHPHPYSALSLVAHDSCHADHGLLLECSEQLQWRACAAVCCCPASVLHASCWSVMMLFSMLVSFHRVFACLIQRIRRCSPSRRHVILAATASTSCTVPLSVSHAHILYLYYVLRISEWYCRKIVPGDNPGHVWLVCSSCLDGWFLAASGWPN